MSDSAILHSSKSVADENGVYRYQSALFPKT